MLDDQLLHDFIQKFQGYGSFEAPWWFIGMEEGGGNDEVEIAGRLSAWARRGRLELEDVAEYHREFGVTEFWSKKPRTQPTWRKLIRLLLAGNLKQSSSITLKQVREYQRDHWGRRHNETCLLELLPLPSPSSELWHYGDWSNNCQLRDRESYREWLVPSRIELIRRRINEYLPKFVIFYGLEYSQHWREIANVEFTKDELTGSSVGTTESTTFLIAPHPASEWSNAFWDKLGNALQEK